MSCECRHCFSLLRGHPDAVGRRLRRNDVSKLLYSVIAEPHVSVIVRGVFVFNLW